MRYYIFIIVLIGSFQSNAQNIIDLIEIHDASSIDIKKELLSDLGYYFAGSEFELNVTVYTFFKETDDSTSDPEFVSLLLGEDINCIGMGFYDAKETDFFDKIEAEALQMGYEMMMINDGDKVYQNKEGWFEDITLINSANPMILYGDARSFGG
jgi:hypothetical protein